ncbi:MAG: hypothetical protein IJ757_02300 [Clostridiales bacterium]|nr:hypothetical protein [Clostridiales bacterium]
MRSANRILLLVGAMFAFVGTVILFAFVLNWKTFGLMSLFPGFFILLGIALMFPAVMEIITNKRATTKGKKYSAKIYGYIEDRSVLVNESYPINTKVRFFDESGNRKEAILQTSFTKGSGDFPIGMTITIFDYKNKYFFDRKSVRDETLSGEADLMDDIPVNTSLLTKSVVDCQSCGATFTAVKGYVTKCPFCGRGINA